MMRSYAPSPSRKRVRLSSCPRNGCDDGLDKAASTFIVQLRKHRAELKNAHSDIRVALRSLAGERARLAEATAENSRLRSQRNSCREKLDALEREDAHLAVKMQTLTAAADAESSRLEEEHGKIIAMRDARIDLLEQQIDQLQTEAVELKSDKVRLYDQMKSLTQERDSAMNNYKMDICNKLKLQLESHVRNVGDIIAANLVSDGEDADAEAAPTADAPAPEAAVAGPVPAESVASDSESSSSTYSGSEAPQGE
jgi:DNA repair exonuclease SbcCD ATPase subunit